MGVFDAPKGGVGTDHRLWLCVARSKMLSLRHGLKAGGWCGAASFSAGEQEKEMAPARLQRQLGWGRGLPESPRNLGLLQLVAEKEGDTAKEWQVVRRLGSPG